MLNKGFAVRLFFDKPRNFGDAKKCPFLPNAKIGFFQKGFLGPIGDDLPSLIPLLFALLIFFSTFVFSYNVFSAKNISFQEDLDVLAISRVLKGTNYVSSVQSFTDSCNSLPSTNLKYSAFITNFFTAKDNYCADPNNSCPTPLEDIKIFDLKPYSVGGAALECGLDLDDQDRTFFFNNKFISKVYPLVAEDNRVVKPMHLVVVAWKE